MDPVIAEMQRARTPIRDDVFRRWASHLLNVVQPQLDELDALKAPTPVPTKTKKEHAA